MYIKQRMSYETKEIISINDDIVRTVKLFCQISSGPCKLSGTETEMQKQYIRLGLKRNEKEYR